MDLLPCPFCGHAQPEEVTVPDRQTLAFAVHCKECGTLGPTDLNALFAAELWNKRAPVF